MTQRHHNPMGLEELQHVHHDVTITMEQLRGALEEVRGEQMQMEILTALYTKALMVKLQVQADMEKFK